MSGRSPQLRASILVIVLVTITLTALALVAFMDKATNDLLIESRDVEATRLRVDAYSSLEVTLAVLEDFSRVLGGLHTPQEGWNDPLTWAGWTPPDGATVDVAFVDESGKISLPYAIQHGGFQTLSNLFEAWQMPDPQAEHLADVLMGWTLKGYVYTTPFYPSYAQSTYPYNTPDRSLRAYSELNTIDDIRTALYDDNGQPNDSWWRFMSSVSLFNFAASNINANQADAITAEGQLTPTQLQLLSDYLNGTGKYTGNGPEWFTTTRNMRAILGASGTTAPFSVIIRALRILITVHDGRDQFSLETVVSPTGNNGAKVVQTNATLVAGGTSDSTGANANDTSSAIAQSKASPLPTPAQTSAAAGNNLSYPWIVLSMRENDRILTPPPAPAGP